MIRLAWIVVGWVEHIEYLLIPLLFVLLGIGLFFLRRRQLRKLIDIRIDDLNIQDMVSLEDAKQRMVQLAKLHQIRNTGRNQIFRHIGHITYRNLNKIRTDISNVSTDIISLIPAARWLFDNFYILLREIKKSNYRKTTLKRLPILKSTKFKGYPRIYAIAYEMTLITGGRLDEAVITEMLSAYNEIRPLTSFELWVFIEMLGICLLQGVTKVADDILDVTRKKSKADAYVHDKMKNLKLDQLDNVFNPTSKVDKELLQDNIFLSHVFYCLKNMSIDEKQINLCMARWTGEEDAVFNPTTTFFEESRFEVKLESVIRSLIVSLREINSIDQEVLFERISSLHQILLQDPAGIFGDMDFFSRNRYRHVVERLSKDLHIDEWEIARRIVQLASEPDNQRTIHCGNHIGAYLVTIAYRRLRRYLRRGKGDLSKPNPTLWKRAFYFIGISAITCGGIGLISILMMRYGKALLSTENIILNVLLLLPLVGISIELTNSIYTTIISANPIPSMDYDEYIPDESRTFVVMPVIVHSDDRAKEYVQRLEKYYFANRFDNIYFALLVDFADAPNRVMRQDESIQHTLQESIRELNVRYPAENARFSLFIRYRKWNEAEGCYMGWERKRGKLEEFNALLCGETNTSFSQVEGQLNNLDSFTYLITLDADTDLIRGSASQMIGTIAHPLNHPVVDVKTRRIIHGYAIIQSEIRNHMISLRNSLFSKMFAGQSGLDTYSRIVSDVYHDTFEQGIFVGKGIYDIKVMHTLLHNAFPENSVLSHDLLESCYVRCAFSSNITLMDNYPSSVSSFIKREHRWVRGDWQLLPWLFKKTAINGVSKWKIFDNLRRSMVPGSLMFALIWVAIVVPSAWYIVMLTIFFGDLFRIIQRSIGTLIQRMMSPKSRIVHRSLFTKIYEYIEQGVFGFILMPYRSYIAIDAVVRTLYRLVFSKKNLLEWQTQDWVDSTEKKGWRTYLSSMWMVTIPAGALIALGFINNTSLISDYIIMLLGFIWMLSPLFASTISRSLLNPYIHKLSNTDRASLDIIALRTWRYFHRFFTEQNHWLCPDNYQVAPIEKVTNKSSPTNIGLQLLSMMSAYDMGYTSLSTFVGNMKKVVQTIENLPKWNGHLYNWYELSTLNLLTPRYVSTVDSGNFIGYVITLQNALIRMKTQPILSQRAHNGLNSIIQLSGLNIGYLQDDMSHDEFVNHIQQIMDTIEGEARQPYENETWTQILRETCWGYLDDLSITGDITHHDIFSITLEDLIHIGNQQSIQIADDLNGMIESLDQMIKACDFSYLFDQRRMLFHIGYHADNQMLDTAYYDLVASECALTSFIAIAKGDIDKKHWHKLSRPLTLIHGVPTHISWSGTMFEYLMPNLILKECPGSDFNTSAIAAVKAQQRFAKELDIPWGISESQYFSFDMNSNYQYKAFGVPSLQLQPRPSKMIVVSPYSTFLALHLSPIKALKNINRLIHAKALGDYGFYEALDYSSPDASQLSQFSIIRAFMAHHQGMVLVSINNFLNNNIMHTRFHANPMVKATEILLEERRESCVITPIGKNYDIQNKQLKFDETQIENRLINTTAPALPRAHWLSNGTYSLMITSDGDGFSRYENVMVHRWRPDLSSSAGNYIYIHDLTDDRYWSTAYKPTLIEPDEYQTVFAHHQAEFYRRDNDIVTRTLVTLSAEDQYEVRKVMISNQGNRDKNIEVTSYLEAVLDTYLNELYHPAFNKLFIESEYVDGSKLLLCKRRKQIPLDRQPMLMHMVLTEAKTLRNVEYETDRLNFIGRNNSVICPNAICERIPLSNKAKFSTDPILSLRETLVVPAGRTVSVSFVTGICFSKDEAERLHNKLNSDTAVDNAFAQFKLNSELEIRYLNINSKKVNAYQDLVAPIFYPNMRFRGPDYKISRNWKNQSFLWRFGVSGDNPILLLCVESSEQISIIRDTLKAYEYFQINRINVDLIILIEGEEGYMQDISATLAEMTSALKAYDTHDDKPSLFILYQSRMDDAEIDLLFTVARIVFDETTGIYFRKVYESLQDSEQSYQPFVRLHTSRNDMYVPTSHAIQSSHLQQFNGYGGFRDQGKEYEIILNSDNRTPMPWINVISNDQFGFHISETGAGYTWAVNSHENKITSWSNDPVTDPVSEGIYIYDEQNDVLTSPTSFGRFTDGDYRVRHGFGYSIFSHTENQLEQEMCVFAALNQPVKIWKLQLRNLSHHTKSLRIYLYAEWVLGLDRALTAPYVVTCYNDTDDILGAKGIYNYEFRKHHAFMFSSEKVMEYTGDRTEFLGINGNACMPMGIRQPLSNHIGAAMDPCGVIAVYIELDKLEDKTIIFGLGQSDDDAMVVQMSKEYREIERVHQELEAIHQYWDTLLSQLQVETQDEALNTMVNGWLLYQTVACRLKARAAFYQCGGAFGFRDQLQDVLSLLDADPSRVRQQIITACGRQFDEGDVQHWWHPPQGLGVRTRISDDLLWLPFVTARYIEHTGDYEVLNEKVRGISGPTLKPQEHDIMFVPAVSGNAVSVFEHCKRTIEHTQLGEHGLPLMGGGDWNDGMDKVGLQGRGESVWLAWFYYAVLETFAPLCHYMEDEETGHQYLLRAHKLRKSIENHAWDGEWYARAYYDNGEKLGTKDSQECKIDSISQSWSVISGGASNARKYQALFSAKRYLVKPTVGISLLLTPPFDKCDNDPGYIKDYYPGIRENGGQYTHAAVWLAIANALVKDCEVTYDLLKMINPINITADHNSALRYEKEPYAVVADISMNDVFAGKGGWSWYTGSAGWLYQAYVRYFLGIRKMGDELEIDPATPPAFGDYRVQYKYKSAIYIITVRSGSKPDSTIDRIIIDGKEKLGNRIQMVDDGKEHEVTALNDYVLSDL